MKKEIKLNFFYLGSYTLFLLIVGIVFLAVGMYKQLIFLAIPYPFTILIFESFDHPKNVVKHPVKMYMSLFFRLLFMICSILLPMLVWKFVPLFNQLSIFYIFLPFAEVMLIYVLSIIYYNLLQKKFIGEKKANV